MARYPFLKYLEVGTVRVCACLLSYLLLMIFSALYFAFLLC